MHTSTKATPAVSHVSGIAGYRDLSVEEKALINDIKAFGELARDLIDRVRALHGREMLALDPKSCTSTERAAHSELISQGQIWRSRASDDLQDGLMKLTRSVARPSTFA